MGRHSRPASARAGARRAPGRGRPRDRLQPRQEPDAPAIEGKPDGANEIARDLPNEYRNALR